MTKPLFDPQPIRLVGDSVIVASLSQDHAEALFSAAQSDSIWSFMPRTRPRDLEDLRAWIDDALHSQELGHSLPFALLDPDSEQAVGSSRYLEIRREHRALEIGWTWIGESHQRTALNTEAKLLLLGHAFESLGAVRVQFKTDSRNLRSQRAIERLGATREGVLRQHMLVQDGFRRDSVYYSILDHEWPALRDRLQGFLAQRRA